MARVKFTAGRLAQFSGPVGKSAGGNPRSQAFLWDSTVPGLGLRVTANGARTYVFQGRLHDGSGLRITIGDPKHWTIAAAQEEARRIQTLIDRKLDPRIARAETLAEQVARREAVQAERAKLEVLGLDAWTTYIEDRRGAWGERYRHDHEAMAAGGGRPHRRSKQSRVTKPGALHALLAKPLAAINAQAVEEWVRAETTVRPRVASLGFQMLRAFLGWCGAHPTYAAIVNAEACASRRTIESLAKRGVKKDALEREQLAVWFAAVLKLPPIPSAYLRFVLLTGCRPGEAAELRWDDVDLRWGAITLKDKVEGARTIPVTPYVGSILRERRAMNMAPPVIPRRIRGDTQAADEFRQSWRPSQWVFPATRDKQGGHITKANKAHERALRAAGLPHVSQHGLRRSFGSLAEWVECPVGIVAQIQGHKPSAIAEKHYRVRPLDLLRMWHTRIEEWILEQARLASNPESTGFQSGGVAA